jgi:hypothetical protein
LVDPAAIAVSIINAANNAIVKKLVALSAFDSHGSEIKAIVSLLFVSRTFNIAIQLAAYAQMVAPLLFLEKDEDGDVKQYFGFDGQVIRQTAKHFEPGAFSCRGNQFGNQFFALLVTDFAMSKIIAVSMLAVKGLVSKVRGKAFPRGKFNIPNKLVALCFTQQLSLMCPVFLPCSSIFAMLFLFINFKFDKVILLHTQKKPKAWAARDANGFYLRFYFISVALVTLATHVLLSLETLPKACSVLSQSIPPFDAAKIVSAPVRARTLGLAQTYGVPADCGAGLRNATAAQALNLTVPVLCACSNACGPWVLSANGYAPILAWIDGSAVAAWAYHYLGTVQLWVSIAACLYVVNQQRSNSIHVNADIAAEASTASTQEKHAQAREIVKLRRKLKLLKKQVEVAEG